MSNEDISSEEQSKIFVVLLQEIAMDKYGTGYQKYIADKTGLYQNNVSRFFSLKYIPKLSTFLSIAKAIDVNFFFEDQNSKTELNILMNRAMDSLVRRSNNLPNS